MGLWGLLGGGMSLVGCSGGVARVAQAPFRLRPDTTVWGSLLGPFDGQIVDQSTGSPVSGALVIGVWTFEDSAGLPTPAGAYTTTAVTGADGNYTLPALPVGERRLSLLRRFTLIAYKTGFSGYRSDYRSDDGTPRYDFAQTNNKVRLDRLGPSDSRARTLVFLGAGHHLHRSAQPDLIQAALELAELQPERTASTAPLASGTATAEASTPRLAKAEDRRPPTNAPTTLASQLLTLTDVEQLASAREARVYAVESAPERSLTFSPPLRVSYSGVHYRASNHPESHDVVLRAYRLGSGRDAETLWKKLRPALLVPPLQELTGAGVAPMVPPAGRAPTPLLPEVPSVSPPLRDGAGTPHAMPLAAPSTAPPAGPLRFDATLRVHDAKQRAYGVAVLIRQHGLVVELICGADLCEKESVATELIGHALGRL